MVIKKKKKKNGIERQFNKLLTFLLGVRKNTSINLCMREAKIPPVQDIMKKRRQRFINKKSEDIDQPFHVDYQLCRETNTPEFKFMEKAVRDETVGDSLRRVVENVQDNAVKTKKLTIYITELNSNINVHQVYSPKEFIPD